MSYTALYRQYRPQRFEEIKGQDHINKTLKNALTSGRLSHAYLFCGPRGTGKTSTAKILAKAVNCPNIEEGEPCNHCHNCVGITNGSSMDVLEIDAASNRGIDEIRELREKISFSPVEGPYKVYIIDEVHMLTTEAFNALLKTLEEPPKHAIFILATTDPRKIPATILSRCQRFDFRQISLPVIMQVLKEVGETAGIKVEEEAYYLMARQAEGGLRDALGLLDQAMAGGAKEITLEEVASLLGAVEDELLLELHQHLATGNIGRALLFLDRLLAEGRELKQIVVDLTLFYRNLLLLSLGGQAEKIVAAPPEIKGKLQATLETVSQAQLLELIKILNQLESEFRWTNQGRIMVELGIIRLAETWNPIAAKETQRIKQVRPQTIKPHTELEMPSAAAEKDRIAEPQKTLRKDEKQMARPIQAEEKTIIPGEEAQLETESLVRNQKEKEQVQGNIELATIKSRWEGFLDLLRKKANVSYSAFLREGELIGVEGSTIKIQFSKTHQFHKERLEEKEVKSKVEEILGQHFETNFRIVCLMEGEKQEKQAEKQMPDIVREAMAIFGGELVDIVEE